MATETGITTFSKKVPGRKENFNWDVSFDETDNFIGISQYEKGNEGWNQRVLLSPRQVDELIKFVKRTR